MNCKTAELLFIDYLDSALATEQAEGLTAHLKECAHCSTQIQQLKALYGLIAFEKEMPVNPFFYTRLKERLEAETGSNQFSIGLIRVLRPLAVAAGVLIGLYIGDGENAILKLEQNDAEVAEEVLLPADYDEMLLTFVD